MIRHGKEDDLSPIFSSQARIYTFRGLVCWELSADFPGPPTQPIAQAPSDAPPRRFSVTPRVLLSIPSHF